MRCRTRISLLSAALLLASAALGQSAAADQSASNSDPATAGSGAETTVWNHTLIAPYWISGQANIILQAHPAFHSPYEGTNSLRGRGEYKTSLLGTLYTGVELGKHTELLLDVEGTG
ncbi:MAG TPA: porin, partial [Terriglobales bacterium]|nr:porin [Terriglobales bacterium]